MLAALGIPARMMPERLVDSSAVVGALLPQVQQAAGEILSFLQVTPPFSRLNRSYFEQKLAAIFSEEYMEDAKAYLQLTQQEQLIALADTGRTHQVELRLPARPAGSVTVKEML